MSRATGRRQVTRITVGAGSVRRADTLTAEEPLEIRIGRKPVAVTMRTPGDELDLALGFLFTEGIITAADDVRTAILCAGDNDEENTFNVVDVTLAGHVPPPDLGAERNFYTTSSCGVCGKASIDAIRVRSRFPLDGSWTVRPEVLAGLPDRLRDAQRSFARTGGLHAAGLFTTDGELVAAREDVGRHNAVDKLVGWALREGRLPVSDLVLMLSGRAGFELVQKAWMAGVGLVAAVSAPSTLAVDLAEEAGMTLVGFLRAPTMNVYSAPGRVA
jgi:FdhD protein